MAMKTSRDILESPAYRGAVAIVRRLRDHGHETYVVGGAPRDLLLGACPTDYDIATDARPAQVRALFEKTIPVGEQFGVILVLMDETPYEVATFRADGEYLDGRRPTRVHFCAPREDALRRDFTVNALMFDPVKRRILDFVDGRRDIRERRIRTVGDADQRFAEDHLRLIRAVRFAARLDFRIERRTLAAIRRLAPLVAKVAAERLGAELVKILTGPRAGMAVRLLSETGLLAHLMPEAEAMRGCEQPPNFHPEGDVFTHTCLMLDAARQPSPALALAVLLHDIAKPPTQRHTPERIRFDGHCELGAEMAGHICRRFKLPRTVIERVRYLTANHLRIKDAPNMRPARLKRFLREEGFPELLELFRLDSLASHGDLDGYEWCRKTFDELSHEQIAPPPLISGHDLIALGYRPGPLFKTILTAVETAQLEGEIATAAEARHFVRRQFPLPSDSR
jgi:poly(A) polymerase